MRNLVRRGTAVWLVFILGVNVAEGGLMIARYAHGHSNTLVDVVQSPDFTPLDRTVEHFSGSELLGFTYTGATTHALHVLVDLRGISDGGFTRIDGRVVFEALPGFDATHADVTLAVDIEGFIDVNSLAFGGWSSAMAFAGSPTSFVGDHVGGRGLPAFREFDEVNSVTRRVELGVPIDFGVALSAGVNATFHPNAWGRADFANSLRFNPDAFFTIHTPGVTANSVDGDWLVNNRLASAAAVPEPSSLVLLGTGALSLAGFRGWRRRRVAE